MPHGLPPLPNLGSDEDTPFWATHADRTLTAAGWVSLIAAKNHLAQLVGQTPDTGPWYFSAVPRRFVYILKLTYADWRYYPPWAPGAVAGAMRASVARRPRRRVADDCEVAATLAELDGERCATLYALGGDDAVAAYVSGVVWS